MLKIQQSAAPAAQTADRQEELHVSCCTKGFRDNRSYVCLFKQSSVWKPTQYGQNCSVTGCLLDSLLVDFCVCKQNCGCKLYKNNSELENIQTADCTNLCQIHSILQGCYFTHTPFLKVWQCSKIPCLMFNVDKPLPGGGSHNNVNPSESMSSVMCV